MSAYRTTAQPTYGTGSPTIRIPNGVTISSVEIYQPSASLSREQTRARALEGGATRSEFDRTRVDWIIYGSLEEAERACHIEVIPEADGSRAVVFYSPVFNLVLG